MDIVLLNFSNNLLAQELKIMYLELLDKLVQRWNYTSKLYSTELELVVDKWESNNASHGGPDKKDYYILIKINSTRKVIVKQGFSITNFELDGFELCAKFLIEDMIIGGFNNAIVASKHLDILE